MAFIFGGNTGNTYEGLQRQRKIAESLLAQSSGTPRNVGEGLTAIGNALAYRAIEKRAAKTEEKLRGEFDTAFSGVFGGGVQAQQPTYSAPAPLSEGEAVANDTMAALGNFGTLESQYGLPEGYLARTYQIESGGNPNAQNPNSSAGGGFQFIDSTAKAYGLTDKTDLGASADAAARLARDNAAALRGVLGRDPTAAELYLAHQQGGGGASALLSNPNALAVDVVGADAVRLNGGDPNMTAGEFANLWLGKFGGGQAQPTQAPQMDLGTLSELAGNPMASPGQKAVLEALIGQQMQAADPMRQIELQRAQLELAQMQNPKVDPMAAVELQQAQLNLEQDRSGAGDGSKEYGLTPQYGTDKDGNLVAIQFAKDGTSIATPLPEGVALSKGIEKLDLGDSYQYVNTMTGEYVGNPIAKNTAAEAANVVAGKAKGEAQAALDSLTAKMPGLETVVAELNDLADKATYTLGGQAWDATVKQLGGAPSASAIARAEYIAKVDNQVLPLLRDTFGAAFTAKEGDALRATLGDPDKSPQEKKAVLNAFIEQKKRDLEALAKQTGEQPATENTGGGLGEWQTIGGVKIRVKQ